MCYGILFNPSNDASYLIMLYYNRKKGTEYIIISDNGVDCTNSRDGLHVIIYKENIDGSDMCVREAKEFSVKFIAKDKACRGCKGTGIDVHKDVCLVCHGSGEK